MNSEKLWLIREAVMKAKGAEHFYRNHIRKVPQKQKNNFFRLMGILMGAGVPVLKAVKMIQRSSRGNIKLLLKDAVALIEQGNDFSKIGRYYPVFFDKMTLSMIGAGEKSGNLPEIFKEVHHNLEKKAKFKRKIRGAMTMPIVTLLFAVGVVFFMAIKVIPAFSGFLSSMGAELPALTQMVLDISTYLLDNWKNIATYSAAVFVSLIVIYKASKQVRYYLDYVLIYTPLVGSIMLYSALTNFSNTMSKLIGSGVGLVESLEISMEGINLMPFKKVLENVKEVIISGGNFSVPFQEAKFVPLIYADILQAGEESGNLEDALVQLMNIYEEETNQRIFILEQAITPIMTLLIGLVVGVVAASLILGMVSLWSATGG
ncbi:MAG: type II secretion system F family protein [Campylobacterales bacterium]|nr:type II secretion system F family protein [Campylobacterales bacterium]